jgi:hypothetical protein
MGERRIQCPYCREKILTNAKKCRFCGEWLDKKAKLFDPFWNYFWYWLLTLVVFWAILFITNFDFSDDPNGVWVIMLSIDVLMGCVFFLLFLGRIVKSVKKNKSKTLKYGGSSFLVIILFFGSLFKVPAMMDKTDYSNVNKIDLGDESSGFINVSPTSKPTIKTEVKVIEKKANTPSLKPSPVPTRMPKKVEYTTTEGITDGTYYCFEDKVNEISRKEQEIEMQEGIADTCTSIEQSKAKRCSENCTESEDIAKCVEDCYAVVTEKCLPKHELVGDLREELHKMLGKYCP